MMPAQKELIPVSETQDTAPATAPASTSASTSAPTPAPTPTPMVYTMVPPLHGHHVVQVPIQVRKFPKERVSGGVLSIGYGFLVYFALLALAIGECKSDANKACIGNHCFQACSRWWLVIIGAIGFFRTLVLSYLISSSKIIYEKNPDHMSLYFFSNHLSRYFEGVFFSFEVVFVVFIGFSIEDNTDEFVYWILTLIFILSQVFVRFICFIRNLVRRNRIVVKQGCESIRTSNV
jgi:hypothetical protein